jgi:uncharacterized protein (UPF0276 family)
MNADPHGRAPYSDLPVSGRAGASLKHQHLDEILADPDPVGFFEIHAENYMGSGGYPHAILDRIRNRFPLLLHGVCMSIGGIQPLDRAHLERFAALVRRYDPAIVSEHLAWSTHDDIFFNDLLPLPYTRKTLKRVCEHVDEMQEAIGRTILLENPATYLLFAESDYPETAFLHEITTRTGCGLLLDVNNVFVSAMNHGFSPDQYLADFPLASIGEIHLAGHRQQLDDEGNLLLIDSHDEPVCEDVWQLFESVIARRGPVPTLIEWDADIPAWPILKSEAEAAQAILDRHARIRTAERSHAGNG